MSSEYSLSYIRTLLKKEPSSEIDWSFFLVLVDLWSADGKQEMNLVLHPSSADRCMPLPAKNRRRGTSINQTPASQQTPIQPSPVPPYPPPEPVSQTRLE